MSNLVAIKQALTDPRSLSQFKLALPANITPEKFQRVALTALLNSPDLAQCSQASIMNALMKCAQDGLLPDNKEAALVKYGTTATYMPMVYGLIKRMRNSGDVKAVNAYLVFEKDEFEYFIEDGVQHFKHRPNLADDRGAAILAYCVVTLEDGTPHIEVMTKSEIEKARKAGKAANGPAWTNWWDEMAKKTVIHRAAKRVPTSSEVAELLGRDMRVSLNGQEDAAEANTTSLVDSINEAITAEVVVTEEKETSND